MLQHTIKAVIRPGEQSGYVAECLEIPVVTQGHTLDEVTRNLQEAVALHLDGEDSAGSRARAEPNRGRHDGAAADACLGSGASPARRSFASSVSSDSRCTPSAVATSSCGVLSDGTLQTSSPFRSIQNWTRGPVVAILRQAARFVADEDLRPHFYTD